MATATGFEARALVLVHGAWHGAWCWERIVGPLRSMGVRVLAVDLPFTSLEDDVAELRRVVVEAGTDVVVCGHSYGGRLASIVADGVANVSHVVYLSSQAPNAAQLVEYQKNAHGGSPDVPSAEVMRAGYYNECSEADFHAVFERLRPMTTVPGMPQGLEHRPWEHIPSTFIVCTRDRAIDVDKQREMAENMAYRTEITADHSAFYSAPGDLIKALASIVRDDRPS